MKRLLSLSAILLLAIVMALAQDGPTSGPPFEKWVRDTFFAGYRPTGPTPRWDVPAMENVRPGSLPVSIEAARFGLAVDLGDALRQYEMDEPFLLIIGFWEQDGNTKRLVNIVAPEISPELWRKLWGRVTYADLLKLDAMIKDSGPSIEENRKRLLRVVKAPPFSEAIIQMNPKIDNHGQRRLQCSIRFSDVFQHLAPGADARSQARPALFGIEYPVPVAPPPRDLK
jgi:hypothetical protein